jgi:hypothetical protein
MLAHLPASEDAMGLRFLPVYLRYNQFTRAVHVVARSDDSAVDVQISRAAIEYLAGAALLNKDDSFTTVIRHKEVLERAANMAIANHHSDGPSISIRRSDIAMIWTYPNADHQSGRAHHE